MFFYIFIRLEEFKVTPTGKLSVQDFRNLWLEQQCDPPAFTRARKAAKIAKDKRHAMASISDSALNESGENYNQITAGSSNGETTGSKRKRDLSDVDGDQVQLRQGMSDFYEDNSQAGESQNDEIASKKRKRNLTDVDKEGLPVRIDKGKQPMCDFEAEVDRVLEEEVNSFLGDKYLLKVSTDLEGGNKILYHFNDIYNCRCS
jgi:transcription factor IIIB subunit 2